MGELSKYPVTCNDMAGMRHPFTANSGAESLGLCRQVSHSAVAWPWSTQVVRWSTPAGPWSAPGQCPETFSEAKRSRVD